MALENHVERLLAAVPEGACLVALSGGVDSAVVLKACLLAGRKTLAVTCLSPAVPSWAREEATRVAHSLGATHALLETGETDLEGYRRNGWDRCFHCKDHLYRRMGEVARKEGMPNLLDGTHRDDLDDFRPGRRAALSHGVQSPLLTAGFGKAEVRLLAEFFGLPNAQTPPEACLSSRVDEGVKVTPELLFRIEAGETVLRRLGLAMVRLRYHGSFCRLEVQEGDIPRLLQHKEEILSALTPLGFRDVLLDLRGYRPARSLRRVTP